MPKYSFLAQILCMWRLHDSGKTKTLGHCCVCKAGYIGRRWPVSQWLCMLCSMWHFFVQFSDAASTASCLVGRVHPSLSVTYNCWLSLTVAGWHIFAPLCLVATNQRLWCKFGRSESLADVVTYADRQLLHLQHFWNAAFHSHLRLVINCVTWSVNDWFCSVNFSLDYCLKCHLRHKCSLFAT